MSGLDENFADRRRPVYHDELKPLVDRLEEIIQEVRAAMSAIQDPETGMMTRAEIALLKTISDARAERDRKDIDKNQRDIETLKSQQLPTWFLGAALGIAGILAGHFWK